jgi:uncharacterized protein YbjT (DUF2867 family)
MNNHPSDLKAAVIGATGLTGSELIYQLCDHVAIGTVNCITRKPIVLSHPKQVNSVFDPADEQSLKNAIGKADLIFCAIGTTFKKVKGDLTAYRKIDHDIPLWAARHGAEIKCRHFSLVSAIGADTKSKNYYLKIKGDTEEDIRSLNLASTAIFRPSLLLGKRKEQRPLEAAGRLLMNPFSFLIPSRYKPIHAHDVAKAMAAEALASRAGFHILYYREMKAHCR